MRSSVLIFVLCAVFLINLISCELLHVVIVSRHGTRAPNPVVQQLCPADKPNLERYLSMDISLAGLTGKGMRELFELGVYTKQKYRDNLHFIGKYFNNSELYVRAVGEDRTIQSAVAWSQALYGPGHSAEGYYESMPSPVPVYTIPDEMDNLLEVRKAACEQRLKKDVKIYDQNVLTKLYQDNAHLIKEMEELCGVDLEKAIVGSGDNLGDAIKDITDAFTFDIIEGFTPLKGLTNEKLLEYRTLAVTQLIGRILGTDEQITYLNGALPSTIRDHFLKSMKGSSKALKMNAYHGHREMMYAVGKFYEIEFDIDFPALPKGAIPPATTLFFELHKEENNDKDNQDTNSDNNKYFVRVYLWHPCEGNIGATPSNNRKPLYYSANFEKLPSLDCPAQQVQLKNCANLDCSLEEFLAIEEKRVARTGAWETLCNYAPDVQNAHMKQPESHIISENKFNPWFILTLAVIVLAGLGIWYYRAKGQNNSYQQLP